MLTDAQKMDVRRWLGYPLLADGESDYVISSATTYGSTSLTTRLETLTAQAEEVLTTVYLTPLASLETAIRDAGENLDTKIAGPWTANDREVTQRTQLFNQVRRDMAAFLGFAPGPSLGAGGNSIALVRA